MVTYYRPLATVATKLARERDWLARQTFTRTPAQDAIDRQANLIAGCVTILNQSPTDYSQWAKRRDRARRIREAARHFGHRKTIRAILELVDLTLSDLASWPKTNCNGDVRTVDPGALDVPEPRKLSAEHIEKLRAGRARIQQALRTPRPGSTENRDVQGRKQAPQTPKKQGSKTRA